MLDPFSDLPSLQLAASPAAGGEPWLRPTRVAAGLLLELSLYFLRHGRRKEAALLAPGAELFVPMLCWSCAAMTKGAQNETSPGWRSRSARGRVGGTIKRPFFRKR